mgnify:FL=1
MKKFTFYYLVFTFFFFISSINAQTKSNDIDEKFRPQIHFTPEKNWVNDPNGMVYYKGKYHLFFQHSPNSSVWSDISWGHATSNDLVHWERKPIAIYPDSLGLIFSGSAVVDKNNSSGLGKNGIIPLVAMYTSHDMKKEKAGVIDVENQSIAYSLDEGETWIKYNANPVLKNPGVRDFRDPKVFWHEQSKNWVASIAAQDQISFYASSDLKNWKKLSDFGKTIGSHDGVWECPDLFPIQYEGKTFWVLIVNINPGGPNGGSATQYFVGDFNGKEFKCDYKQVKWMDYGPDEYAGVTWSNTGNRKLFIGWMSNWEYANIVPTEKFRNAFTLPRELGLKKINEEYYITSTAVPELKKMEKKSIVINNLTINGSSDLTDKIGNMEVPSKFNLVLSNKNDFSIELVNTLNEKVVVGYSKDKNQFFLDRRNAGKTDFQKNFARMNYAPRLSSSDEISLSIYLDLASIEVFADNGLSVLTSVLFPNEKFSKINFITSEKLLLKNFTYTPLNSIW